MGMSPLLLAIDQGTTSSRSMVFDATGSPVAQAQETFSQHFPKNGWVEHDPEDIWRSCLSTARKSIKDAECGGGQVAAIGITNQRETTVLWDRNTGEPVHPAIVWQDRRTAELCQSLRRSGHESVFQKATGLVLDPYFSASKIAWLLLQFPELRERATRGDIAFGTVDSFLLWRLTGGRVHATDATNASRTGLFNIHTQCWDESLLGIFDIPRAILPEVFDCVSDFGEADAEWFGRKIPISGVAGDQHAALIAQCCFSEGEIKSTYGTGCFVLANTGKKVLTSNNRLLSTVAYRINGETHYALEGAVFNAGTVVQWLRDNLGVLESASESADIAASCEHNGGVSFVPAFTGMGAPYWQADARAAIVGITRGTGQAHIVRAALESICLQTDDLLRAMRADGAKILRLRVDGGMVVNDWLMQCLADVLGLPIDRPRITETTALGAAMLAGLGVGVFRDTSALDSMWQREKEFHPRHDEKWRYAMRDQWRTAVDQVLAPF